MPMSDDLHTGFLTQMFGGSEWTPPSSIWVGLHRAATLSTDSDAGESFINLNENMYTGARLNISSASSTEEVAYVGSISGSGPYTANLINKDGSDYSLIDNHYSGDYVEFMPTLDDAYTLEPTSSQYARVELANNSTSWNQSGTILENAVDIGFPEAGSDWGLITSFLLYDSSSGGSLLWAYKAEWNVEAANKNNFVIKPGGLNIEHQV